jgi:DNA-binding HxlR family transcriptional regulator
MEITISLNVFERRFLLFIASRGNEVDMDHNGLTTKALDALNTLLVKGAIIRTPLIGRDKTYQYKLTQMGTNLVDIIKENEQ